ncbi:MAG: arginase family protein, partial [Patescibacteria group bacterium]
MTATIINNQKPNEANVVLIGIPFDRSSGLNGADGGPEAIRKMLNEQIELYEPITGTSPAEYLNIAYKKVEGLKYTNAESMVKMVKSCASAPSLVGKFPIAIGGDHSISIGILQAMAEIHKNNLPTILQIDAHFDLRDDDSDFRELSVGRYAHCCVMRRAAE